MFMLVVAPMRAVGVSRALMEVARRVSAINGFFARARTLLTVRDDEWRRRSRLSRFRARSRQTEMKSRVS